MYQSLFAYADRKYLLQALLLSGLCVAAYAWHQPAEPPNGGTWLGYTLGTVGALLIVWLALYGVRKRSYRSRLGSVQGWLSAHVYFGAALLLIATLHSAGELGWNVHSLAYVLMCIVVGSGFYGVYLYTLYPRRLSAALGDRSRDEVDAELQSLGEDAKRLARGAMADVQVAVSSAVDRTALPQGTLSRLLGRDESKVMLGSADQASSAPARLAANPGQSAILRFLTVRLAHSRGGPEALILRDLIDIFAQRRRLLTGIVLQHALQTRLRAWLVIHLPFTFALLTALAIHILTVFVYW